MKLSRLALFFLCLSGCGRYSDFTLPAPAAPPRTLSFDWKPDPDPVLSPGDWDSVDVLSPSVVRRDNLYYNLYSGYDGKTWSTGLATSPDGAHWQKQGKVLSPQPDTWESNYIAANGSVLYDHDAFLYWYESGPRERLAIGLARSPDAKSWSKHPAPVLEPGPLGSFDESAAADPAVLRIGDAFYMYYLGQDRARRQRIGLARSPDGVRWTKLRSNPVLEPGPDGAFDEEGVGEPAVWQSQGKYWMLYRGRDRKEFRRLGLAHSNDGVHWTKLPGSFSGAEPWNSKVLCDPTVLIEGDTVRVWFGGGDIASPDENLHGRIGTAILFPRP